MTKVIEDINAYWEDETPVLIPKGSEIDIKSDIGDGIYMASWKGKEVFISEEELEDNTNYLETDVSTNTIDESKAGKTAITRKKPSRPALYVEEHSLAKGKVLDFGAGRGLDADNYGWDKYDPNHAPADLKEMKGQYDTVICNYVFNVVNQSTEDILLKQINDVLKPNGVAYISVRRDISEDTGSQRLVKLNLPLVVEEKGAFAMYKFTKKDIKSSDETDELIKASGCVYKNGYWTVSQFENIYGFTPNKYPEYFRVTDTGKVVAKQEYHDYCDRYFDNVKNNWTALGIKSADDRTLLTPKQVYDAWSDPNKPIVYEGAEYGIRGAKKKAKPESEAVAGIKKEISDAESDLDLLKDDLKDIERDIDAMESQDKKWADQYDSMLDESTPEDLGCYPPSAVLKEVDPTGYDVGFADSELEDESEYDEMLDNGTVKDAVNYPSSYILKEYDITAYDTGYNDWVDEYLNDKNDEKESKEEEITEKEEEITELKQQLEEQFVLPIEEDKGIKAGSSNIGFRLPGNMTIQEVKKAFQERHARDIVEYGTDAYNGSWSTIQYVKVIDKVYETQNEASDYCLDNAEKWEYAIAVKYKGEDGEIYWNVEGWCAE